MARRSSRRGVGMRSLVARRDGNSDTERSKHKKRQIGEVDEGRRKAWEKIFETKDQEKPNDERACGVEHPSSEKLLHVHTTIDARHSRVPGGALSANRQAALQDGGT